MRSIVLLRTTYALAIGFSLARIAAAFAWPSGVTTGLAFEATAYAANLALLAGCLDLAARLGGRAALGARIAAAAYALALVLDVGGDALGMTLPREHGGWALTALQLGGLVAGLSVTTGFTLAAWSRRPQAIWAALLTLAPLAMYVLPKYLDADDVGSMIRQLDVSSALLKIAHDVGLLWLAMLAAPPESEPAPSLAARGTRWLAVALWLRVAAGIALALLGLVSATALLVQPIAQALALAGFALGAFAVCRGTGHVAFAIAGIAVGWCAGAALALEPWIYEMRGDEALIVGSLLAVLPVVVAAAIATTAFALRRLPRLAAVGAGPVIAFVALELASLGLATASQAFVAGVLDITATAVAALWLGRAADELAHDEPTIPTAKIV